MLKFLSLNDKKWKKFIEIIEKNRKTNKPTQLINSHHQQTTSKPPVTTRKTKILEKGRKNFGERGIYYFKYSTFTIFKIIWREEAIF